MIKVHFTGRLGNNMFQYCFGRILAEQMEYKLECPLIPYFKNAILIDGNIITNFIVIDRNFRGTIKDLLYWKNERGIILTGFYQNQSFYIDKRNEIREWFKYDVKNKQSILDNDIVLHIRRTDYYGNNSRLKLNFYTDILDNGKYNNIFICGDEFDLETREILKRFNPIYVHESEIDDMMFISQFNNIIMSNSTYAWWAAFLSFAKNIFYPIPKNDDAFFGKNSNQELYLKEFIKCEKLETF